MIKQWDNTELWYKKDDKFQRPKSMVTMKVYTQNNDFSKSAEGRLFANIWKDSLDEYLQEFSYQAACANLSLSTTILHDNIHMAWSGYHDSMKSYVMQTVDKINEMKNADLKDIFEQVKEKKLREWKNFYLEKTYLQLF